MKLGAKAKYNKHRRLFSFAHSRSKLGALGSSSHAFGSRKSKKYIVAPVLMLVVMLASPFMLGVYGGYGGESSIGPSSQGSTHPQETSSLNSSEERAKQFLDDKGVTGLSYGDIDFSSSDSREFASSIGNSDSDNFCEYGCSVRTNSGETIRISCYSSSSCTAYSSSGETYYTNCYSSSSCSAYDSSGNYAHTSCYTSSSCSTYDSSGNYSNTSCYGSKTCSTYSSDGSYSSTNCYTSSSCSTYDSNGGYSSTTCYSSSCSTYGTSGSYYSY